MLAFMLRRLFNTHFVQYSPYLPKSWAGVPKDGAREDRGVLVPRADPHGGVPMGVQLRIPDVELRPWRC